MSELKNISLLRALKGTQRDTNLNLISRLFKKIYFFFEGWMTKRTKCSSSKITLWECWQKSNKVRCWLPWDKWMELEALRKRHSQKPPSVTGADYMYIFDWEFYSKFQSFFFLKSIFECCLNYRENSSFRSTCKCRWVGDWV